MGEKIMDVYILYSRYFGNPFFSAYTILALVLLTCSGLPAVKIKREAFNGLFVVHSLLPWLCLINLLFQLGELFLAWYGQNPYELHAFYPAKASALLQLFYLMSLIIPLAGLLFYFKKLKIYRPFIFSFILIFNSGKILTFILSSQQDYLPSSWQLPAQPVAEQIFKWLPLPAALLLSYWFLNKKNKLPYPSLFLKSNVSSV